MTYITLIIYYGLEIYKWLILAALIIHWLPALGIHVDRYNPIIQFLHQVTEPVLRPLRPYFRTSKFDFTPLVVVLVIWLLQIALTDISEFPVLVARLIALVVALTVHEFMHAYAAYQLGDSTAKHQGRLTLDPRHHLDVLGSIMVITAGFGWARPVPVNPYNLRGDPKTGLMIVAAAGPLSNLALAFVAAMPFRLGILNLYSQSFVTTLFLVFISLNIALFFFNLLPIAPLDGSKIVAGLLPYHLAQKFNRLEPFGPFILLFLVFFLEGLFIGLVLGPTQFVIGLLIG